jgi:hypothetical protein
MQTKNYKSTKFNIFKNKYEKRMLFLLASLCAMELHSDLHTLSKKLSAPAATNPATRSGPPAPPADSVSDLSCIAFSVGSATFYLGSGDQVSLLRTGLDSRSSVLF